ncbi:response regulator transcription factor [Oryzibacter oryziterrae]|uniref:response regulator transcription factor n=1 Tax=Oryzibacter oryziterrae TaxID=2766474 RepID=UPI001F0225D5|nr:LuxR C-terminal-related transcriptional regulator [Oryzibacter oryziterrae]
MELNFARENRLGSAVYPPLPPEDDETITLVLRARDADGLIERVCEALPPGCLVYARRDGAAPSGSSELTARQREILELLLLNLSNKEIGRRLGLSHFTIRNRVSQLFRHLNLSSRAEVIRRFGAAHAAGSPRP